MAGLIVWPTVEGFVSQGMGSSAYVSLEWLQNRLGLERMVAGLAVQTTEAETDSIVARLERLPGVSQLAVQSLVREGLEEFMGLLYGFLGMMILFSALLAFAVVFNTVTVSVMERRRELASMRMIGASLRSIGVIVTVENLLIATVGVVAGVVAGRLLAVPMVQLFNSDVFTIDRVLVRPVTLVGVVVGLFAVVLLSGSARHPPRRPDAACRCGA